MYIYNRLRDTVSLQYPYCIPQCLLDELENKFAVYKEINPQSLAQSSSLLTVLRTHRHG